MESSALPSTTTTALTLRNYNFANNHHVMAAMQNLKQVGDLLHLAYAGSKTFRCNEQVVAIVADYQTLIKDFHVAMNACLLTYVRVLEKHKFAIACVQQEKFEKALEIIEGCAVVAEKMAAASGVLAEQSQNLCTKSRAALLAATHDGTVSEEKKKRIRDQIIALDAKEERLKQLTQDLAKHVQEEKDRERVIAKQEMKAHNRAFVVKVIASAMTPVTKGEAIASTRAQMQNEEREANADLAESVSNLKNLNIETDTLDQAVASLDLCVKTMGKIKTVFENARLYWLGVATHYKGLTDIRGLSDPLGLGGAEFEDALQECAGSWLTLGQQNLLACKVIEAVNSHVDNFLGNLPTREESAKLIKKIEIFGIEDSHA